MSNNVKWGELSQPKRLALQMAQAFGGSTDGFCVQAPVKDVTAIALVKVGLLDRRLRMGSWEIKLTNAGRALIPPVASAPAGEPGAALRGESVDKIVRDAWATFQAGGELSRTEIQTMFKLLNALDNEVRETAFDAGVAMFGDAVMTNEAAELLKQVEQQASELAAARQQLAAAEVEQRAFYQRGIWRAITEVSSAGTMVQVEKALQRLSQLVSTVYRKEQASSAQGGE